MAPKKTTEVSVGSKKAAPAVSGEFDELTSALAEARGYEEEERARTGSSLTWITCVQPGAGPTNKADTAAYMKGVEAGDFVIADQKLLLGESQLRGTIIGMFKVYAQVKKAESNDEMAKTLSFWHPDDAEQIPLEGQFDRPLSDGTVLQPMHWVFIEVEGHEEIVDAMLSFRSKGNAYYAAFNKILKKATTIAPEVKVVFKSVADANNTFKKPYMYPQGEIEGKNFNIDKETNKITLIKGAMTQKDVDRVLQKYIDLQKAFHSSAIVSRRSPEKLQALIPGHGSAMQRAIPAGMNKKGGYAEDEATDGPARF